MMTISRGADNRGQRAGVRNGEAIGSGSGAGGGGAPEDIDADSAAGSGADLMPRAKPEREPTGADAENHGSA